MTARARSTGRARRARPAPSWSSNGRKDSAAQPDKSRFVFAYTNDDVATAQRRACAPCARQRGELGEDHELDDRARPAALRRRRPHPVHRHRQEGRHRQRRGRHHRGDRRHAPRRQARRPRGEDDQFRRREFRAIPPRLCRHDLQRARAARSIRPISTTRSTGARPRAMSR